MVTTNTRALVLFDLTFVSNDFANNLTVDMQNGISHDKLILASFKPVPLTTDDPKVVRALIFIKRMTAPLRFGHIRYITNSFYLYNSVLPLLMRYGASLSLLHFT